MTIIDFSSCSSLSSLFFSMTIIHSNRSRAISLILTLFLINFFWLFPFGGENFLLLNSDIANAVEFGLGLGLESSFVKNNIDIEKINFELFNRQTYEINVAKTYYFISKENELLEKLRSNGLGDNYKSPLKFYKKGIDAMREGNYDAAVRYYTDCIKQPTNFAEAYIARGQAYLKQNNFEKAVEDFSHAMTVEPSIKHFYEHDGLTFDSTKYVDPLIARANLYASQHQYENAIADLDEALQRNPDFDDAYLAKANVYLDQGKYPEALRQIKIALDYNPQFLAAFLVRGIVNIKQKQYQKAIDNLNQIIKIQDSVEDAKTYLPQTYYSMGFANLMLGKNQEAVKYFTNTLALDENFKIAYLEKGLAEFDLVQYENVIRDIEMVSSELESYPSYEVAYYTLGISYLKMNQYPEADSIFTRMIAKYPDSGEIYYCRGLAKFNLKNYQVALNDLNKAISMNYKTPESYVLRGSILSNLGKNEESIIDYTQAIGLNSKYSDAFEGRGDVYYNLKDYQKAIQDYTNSIESNPLLYYHSSSLYNPKYFKRYIKRGKAYYYVQEYSKGDADFNKVDNYAFYSKQSKKQFLDNEIFPLIDVQDNSSAVTAIDISSDNVLASGGNDGSITIWRITDKGLEKLKPKPSAHSRRIRDLIFTQNGKVLVSASDDRIIKLWDVNPMYLNPLYLINNLQDHSAEVTSVAGSHDNRFLASGSDDKTIKLWNLETGNELRTMSGYSNYVEDVVFSLDDQFLATSTYNGKIVVWKIDKKGEFLKMQAHTSANSEQVRDLAFSPNGKLLASASDDNTIRLWNPRTGDLIRTLEAHSDNVTSVAISPDGKLLASGSDDKTVKLWNLETGNEITTFLGHTNYVQDVAFSPDGHFLVSGDYDNNILVRRIPN